MPLYTHTQPSKSLADRIYTAEFDDAVIEQHFWKNPRYEGCKVISKEINKYTPLQTASSAETGVGFASIVPNPGPGVGGMVLGGTGQSVFTINGYYTQSTTIGSHKILNIPGTFKVGGFIPKTTWQGDSLNPSGLIPNLQRLTTAIYISNTVIGGTEDPQFATIKNHSYININQILLIDPSTDEVQLLDRQAEDFIPFHSFITNDLPTQESFSIRVIDEAIANNLKGPNQYKVKMNKGLLLKTFDYKFDNSNRHLVENNSMYLYKGGRTKINTMEDGNEQTPDAVINDEVVRFRYGTIEMIEGDNNGKGSDFALNKIGPSFALSSIVSNKFTQQYYSGSFGLVNEPTQPQGISNGGVLKTSGLGSASRFIGISTLDFLKKTPSTELHLTLFEGTKDFSLNDINPLVSANDERSISTFEVDSNQSQLDIGGICNEYLPKTHEIRLKGLNDDRFKPKGHTFRDNFQTAYITGSAFTGGCIAYGTNVPGIIGGKMQLGINVDKVEIADVFVQGGVLGVIGYVGVETSSLGPPSQGGGPGSNLDWGVSLSGSMSSSNYYSGSFDYQLSFLDKDHTIITNLDKTAELFDGIGSKGIILIPNNTHPKIKNNINFYLKQAGILPTSPNAQVQLTQDS